MPNPEEVKVFNYEDVFVSYEAMEEIKNWDKNIEEEKNEG